MDIKSKNYHKITLIIIALVILLPSLAMMVIRPHYIKQQRGADGYNFPFSASNLPDLLVESSYVLHAEEIQGENQTTMMPFDIFFPYEDHGDGNVDEDDYSYDEPWQWAADVTNDMYDDWSSRFIFLRPYIEYEVIDGQSKEIIDSNRGSDKTENSLSALLSDYQKNGVLDADDDYAFLGAIGYGENGNINFTSFISHEQTNTSQVLNKSAKSNPASNYDEDYGYNKEFQKPQNRIYYFAMTTENLKALKSANSSFIHQVNYYTGNHEGDLVTVLATLMGIVAIVALLLPSFKFFTWKKEKIFAVPFEIVFAVSCTVIVLALAVAYNSDNLSQQAIYNVLTSIGSPELLANTLQYLWGLFGWIGVFTVCYWTAGCARRIFVLGPKTYIKESVLVYRIYPWMKKQIERIIQSLLHVDLRSDTNKILIKVILINFIILGFISLFWFWGIGVLIVYSVVLFFLLRKYLRKIQDQYRLLLEATNELAKGNLNGTIPEDLGIFEPFRDEIGKIQTGFKKAVDEEVKSTKMKTDLITNVSHDLKTPLTAIITYVDLLKKEDLSEEDRRKYTEILDTKANRLKILIEDLFEVSKATSKTVTLNIMDVDIVSLMRQVKLELQDKIDATDLLFRWQLPEEKVILPLDSQRTYRVFENLIVNITKYAMPRTRVYITMENTENHVKIIMKNISATELNFNPNEITERFVRGDVSRNTEGSGLGLAIAKSFTELQGGRLDISTDADLFTAEITFLKQ